MDSPFLVDFALEIGPKILSAQANRSDFLVGPYTYYSSDEKKDDTMWTPLVKNFGL